MIELAHERINAKSGEMVSNKICILFCARRQSRRVVGPTLQEDLIGQQGGGVVQIGCAANQTGKQTRPGHVSQPELQISQTEQGNKEKEADSSAKGRTQTAVHVQPTYP